MRTPCGLSGCMSRTHPASEHLPGQLCLLQLSRRPHPAMYGIVNKSYWLTRLTAAQVLFDLAGIPQ